ncbi:16S rRNA (guanine(527)-N(7))-methyltransferase RsmG [Miniimonas arenae]|uniref:Ribosomal RNA small subunit methyltransferase G n=1 Tax=Miniimonas arenae TaxID=676201 RepID=A0A5C5BB79_9MICO|nr:MULTISPECIES: 16S rRNA (guanine(527)-N(7))-methyltransferase RsmG [Miniimonas]TNU73973.1 16S rRNA (guanine(527)-N(7))-methyltransferase RsmG [Miniimonas arenae]
MSATEAAESEPEATPGSREVLGAGYDACVAYYELLRRHGEERGLVGPRELGRLWTRHVLNSAAVLPYLPGSGSVADVGSGAGLPGVVLAAVRPDLTVTLIEPMERRVEWLELVAAELSLTNVSVVQGQAQELHGKARFDAVTARAVAALDKLVTWTWPLVAPGGALLAMKGQRAAAELEAAGSTLRRLGAGAGVVHDVDVLGDGDVTRVVEIRRVGGR